LKEENQDFFTCLKSDILASQLLETAIILIEAVKKWAEENGIDLSDCDRLNTLIADAKKLIRELDYLNSSTHSLKASDEKKQPYKSDEEGQVPPFFPLIT
jgi:hypothetical protein